MKMSPVCVCMPVAPLDWLHFSCGIHDPVISGKMNLGYLEISVESTNTSRSFLNEVVRGGKVQWGLNHHTPQQEETWTLNFLFVIFNHVCVHEYIYTCDYRHWIPLEQELQKFLNWLTCMLGAELRFSATTEPSLPPRAWTLKLSLPRLKVLPLLLAGWVTSSKFLKKSLIHGFLYM